MPWKVRLRSAAELDVRSVSSDDDVESEEAVHAGTIKRSERRVSPRRGVSMRGR